MTAVSIAIFLVSAAVLALELVLVRALSIGHWHHFSFLVISTALLGFGAGGAVVAIFSGILTNEHRKALWYCALGLGLSAPLVFFISQKVPLDELQIVWHWRQSVFLFAYYLLFFIPFFFAGSFVALCFTVLAERAHRLYFWNMTGSGLGAGAIVVLMYGHSPGQLLLVIASAAFVAGLVLAVGMSKKAVAATAVFAVVVVFAFCEKGPFTLDINISQHKTLVWCEELPESEKLAVRWSPLARLDCVRAPGIHIPPAGLSITYQGDLPGQFLIISDADAVSVVNEVADLRELSAYEHTTSALGYVLLDEPDACIIGPGGGCDVAQALLLGARQVTVVEMNPQVVELLRYELGEFAGWLFEQPQVRLVVAEGRSFLQTTSESFDIISMSVPESISASAAGPYALSESHLYTIEAIEQALRRLRPNGLLSITLPLKIPPRYILKSTATIVEALKRLGLGNPAGHITIIRRLHSTATIVVSPQPFSHRQIEKAGRFAREHSFDVVHAPGIKAEEANRFHVLDEPVFYKGVRQILFGKREDFLENYAYNIQPATDDRPYFFDFFRWKGLVHIARSIKGRRLPLTEWGYLVLVATLIQAAVAGVLFILLPIWAARPLRAVESRKAAVLSYFLLLGLGYMFLEMGFIQKLTLLIGYPVFGVAVTLVGFLVFSGCGSAVAGRFSRDSSRRLIWTAVLAVIIIGAVEITVLKLSFNYLVGFSRPVRCLVGLGITVPPAFFMGMPFPTAIRELRCDGGVLVPWAWCVNGFASVTGAVLGTLLAVSFGFTMVVLVAMACYFLAALISKRLCA